MTADEDQFRDWDAAYVLGALSPEDRRAYEEHLRTCDACRAALGELAGIPGLDLTTMLSAVTNWSNASPRSSSEPLGFSTAPERDVVAIAAARKRRPESSSSSSAMLMDR